MLGSVFDEIVHNSAQLEAPPARYSLSGLQTRILQYGVIAILLAWLYIPILFRLVRQWYDDPNYSHGFLVPAFAIFVLFRQRSRLADVKYRPSGWGFLILALGLAMLTTGVFGAEIFLSRTSLLFVTAGLIVFLAGWQYFRIILFPWGFLFLMIPIPAIILSRITFPLQILASKIAEAILPLAGVPVLREGNIINLPAMPLEVAEACSGIRSLLSLVTLTIIYGFLTNKGPRIRVALAVASVPIAVTANSLRIVITGMLVEYWDASKAQGFFHSFSGWVIFLVSIGMLTSLDRLFRSAELHANAV